MSAGSTVVYFGLQFEVPESEVELLELRKHPLQVMAREADLQFYWGDFAESEPKFLLFLGKKVAIIGLENQIETRLSFDELSAAMTETQAKLKKAGFLDKPELILRLLPDA